MRRIRRLERKKKMLMKIEVEEKWGSFAISFHLVCFLLFIGFSSRSLSVFYV